AAGGERITATVPLRCFTWASGGGPVIILSMEANPVLLRFDGGTVLVSGADSDALAILPGCRLDPRTGSYRAEARYYRGIVETLRQAQRTYRDEARAYQPTPWPLRTVREPFPHQTEALDTWWQR